MAKPNASKGANERNTRPFQDISTDFQTKERQQSADEEMSESKNKGMKHLLPASKANADNNKINYYHAEKEVFNLWNLRWY